MLHFKGMLAAVTSAEQMLTTMADSIGYKFHSDISPQQQLLNDLLAKKLLLIIDNFEHLLAAAPMVSALLQRTARLKILVTSRAALNVAGEHRLVIPPLSLPSLAPLPALEQLRPPD